VDRAARPHDRRVGTLVEEVGEVVDGRQQARLGGRREVRGAELVGVELHEAVAADDGAVVDPVEGRRGDRPAGGVVGHLGVVDQLDVLDHQHRPFRSLGQAAGEGEGEAPARAAGRGRVRRRPRQVGFDPVPQGGVGEAEGRQVNPA
jgi:hypothetical protein